jgi:hypothetical protein
MAGDHVGLRAAGVGSAVDHGPFVAVLARVEGHHMQEKEIE